VNKKLHQERRIGRRDVLRLITAVPGAALISTAAPNVATARSAAEPATAAGPAAYQPKVFNRHEWKTIRVLCDLIIPADQVSGGAVDAGVPEFIDDWVNFKSNQLAAQIHGGVTWLDLESNRQFHLDFADCSAEDQRKILDRIAYPQKATPADANAVAFFNQLRDLVVSGFFTSRAGIKDLPYLGNEPQSEWDGCPSPVLAKLGLTKS
jgi:Gluconate 2-dehydrogenase subunit 3